MRDEFSHSEKIIDPRLQAREGFFQRIHLSVFETMSYAQAIQQEVEKTGQDIDADNQDFQQLLRDYQITKNLTPIAESPLENLCDSTDELIKTGQQAYANCAQLCAAAISALNHWRILSDIPEDLRSNETVTKTLKQKFQEYMHTWEFILSDLDAQ